MKKINFKIPIIIVLTIILIILCCFYFKADSSSSFDNINDFQFNQDGKENIKTSTISTTTSVLSALSENIELHATYYLEESYVEENQLVKKGENILKYTNGTYLTAPYDCVITEINIPFTSEQCTNNHYIKISSNNILEVQIDVEEGKIDNISLGDEATIKLPALDNKEYYGVVTGISNSASNGKFTVTVEFENDGNVKIGMTAEISI